MLNKDIARIEIGVLEILVESCKNNPDDMYDQARAYLFFIEVMMKIYLLFQ